MLKHHGVWGVKPLIAFIDKTLRYVIISFLAIPQNWLLTTFSKYSLVSISNEF